MKSALDEVLAALADPGEAASRDWLVGEPFFEPPAELLEGLREAAEWRRFGYPPKRGLPGLLRAIQALHEMRGERVDAGQIVVTHGSKGGLLAVFGTLLEKGEELLVVRPSYPAYEAMAATFGAEVLALEERGGSLGWCREQLAERATERTRLLVLSSPSNPTGATLTRQQATSLVTFCRERGLRLLCDEAYLDFRRDGETGSPVLAADPRLETAILLRSFSKSHAVCGWRLGYVLADAPLVERLAGWQSGHLNPPNAIAQRALERLPSIPESYARSRRREVAERGEVLVAELRAAGIESSPPAGGFYLFLDLRQELARAGIPSTQALCCELARRENLALWPGEDYRAPGHVRVSLVASPRQRYRTACRRLARALASTLSATQERA